LIIPIYKALISLSFPIIKATYIKKRQKTNKEHPVRFNERIGLYTHPRPEGKLYWLHGASVGESISMLPLIDKLLKEDKNLSIMVTTGTITSAEIMAKRLPERAFHQFIPYDVPKFARNLLNHFKPDAVLWFESELWPSLISEIHKTKVPLILVNGRISDKSFNRWKKFKFLSKELLSYFSLCLGQSEQDKNRLKILGATNVDCVGNLKYAGIPLPVDPIKKQEIVSSIGNRRVFLLSSTHSNEEEQFAEHLKEFQRIVKDVLIISVPRHPHRGKEISETFNKHSFTTALRSNKEPLTAETEVYVADTIGEMGIWYSIADVTFVGGSLIKHGGQNFIEPARDKNAVIVGAYMHNFKEMLERAQSSHAVIQRYSAPEVIEEAISLFMEEELLNTAKQNAYNWAEAEAKVLDGIKDALVKELSR
jgi:3-deoxy-D-manno-octulosonic-acid transferase